MSTKKAIIQDYLHAKLTQNRVILDSASNRLNLSNYLHDYLETTNRPIKFKNGEAPSVDTLETNSKVLLDTIISELTREFNQCHNSFKLEMHDISINNSQEKFKQFITSAIDAALAEQYLADNFFHSQQAISLIKQACNRGDGFYVRHKLAILIADEISKKISAASTRSQIQDEIDNVLYSEESNKATRLIQAASHIRHTRYQLEEITEQTIKKRNLIKYFNTQRALLLQSNASKQTVSSISNEETSEAVEQVTEYVAESSEVVKLVGELGEIAEQSHHAHALSHVAEASSNALVKAGGIGTLIGGILGALIIPVRCLIEKRKPTLPECGMMGLSTVSIVLGSLAIASVGGPVGVVGAFALTATVIGLGKTFLTIFKEFHEHRHLKKKASKLQKELEDLDIELKDIQNDISDTRENLNTLLTSPPESHDNFKIEMALKALSIKHKKAHDKIEQMKKLNSQYANTSLQLLKLSKQQASNWYKVQKVVYISSGALAIAGAVLMLNPVTALVGVGLMLAAAAMTITTLASSFIARLVHKFQAKKAPLQKQTEHASSIDTKDTKESTLVTNNQTMHAQLSFSHRLPAENDADISNTPTNPSDYHVSENSYVPDEEQHVSFIM